MSSKLVDQRVVEMQFDNRNFERNVNESIRSIDKLKASLDFSAVEVAAITAISNITNKLTDMGLNLAKSLSLDQLTSGWEKYESKSKSVGTLLAQGIGLDEINTVIDKLQWFTDETSYSFQEMFNTITKFQSSGLSLTESLETVEGIALAAASVGQNAAVATSSMIQLQQAIPTGFIKYKDWQEGFINRNMASREIQEWIADTAASMSNGTSTLTKTFNEQGEIIYKTVEGTAYKLEELFGHTLTEELWLSTEVFVEAMTRMTTATEPIKDAVDSLGISAADATDLMKTLQTNIDNINIEDLANQYGIAVENISDLKRISQEYNQTVSEQAIKFFQSAQECRTLADAIGAVKEAVSSDWAQIWENIFGDYNQGKVLWTNIFDNLYTMFVEPMNRTLKSVEEWKKLGGWDDLFGFDPENEAHGALFNVLNAIQDIIDLVGGAWRKVFSLGGNAFKSFTKKLKEGTAYLRLSQETLDKVSNILTVVFDILKKGLEVFVKVFKIFKPLFSIILRVSSILIDTIDKIATKISNIINNNSYVIKSINIVTISLEKLCDILVKVIEYILDIAEGFKSSGGNIVDGFINGLKHGIVKIKDTIVGLASNILKWFNEKLDINSPSREFFKSGKNVVDGLIEGFKSKYVEYKKSIIKFIEGPLTEFGHKLEDNWFLGPILSVIKNVYDIVYNLVSSLIEAGKTIGSLFGKQKAIQGEDKSDKLGRLKHNLKFIEEEVETTEKLVEVQRNEEERAKHLLKFTENITEKEQEILDNKQKRETYDKHNLKYAWEDLEYTEQQEKSESHIVDMILKMSEGLQSASDSVKNYSERLKTTEKSLKGTILNGVSYILNIVGTILSILSKIFEKVANSKIANFLYNTYTSILGFINTTLSSFNELLEAGESFASAFGKSIMIGLEGFKKVDKVQEKVSETVEATQKLDEDVEETAEKTKNVGTVASEAFTNIINIFEQNAGKLSEVFTGLLTIVAYVADKISTLLSKIFDSIIKTEKDFVENDALGGIFDSLYKIYESLVVILGGFVNLFTDVLDRIAEALTTGTEGENSALSIFFDSLLNLINAFINVINSIIPILTGVIDKFTALLNNLNMNKESPMVETLYTLIDNVLGILKLILDRFVEFFGDIKDNIAGMKEGSNIIKFIIKILPYAAIALLLKAMFENLTIIGRGIKMVKSLSWVPDAFADVMYGVALYSKALAVKAIANSLMDIAKALTLLSIIDTENLLKGSAVLGVTLLVILSIAIALNAWFKNMNKVGKLGPKQMLDRFNTITSGYAKIATMLATIGLSMLIISTAITILAKQFKPGYGETVLQAAGRVWQAFTMILGAIIATTIAIKQLNKGVAITGPVLIKNMVQLGLTMLILSGAIAALATTFKYNQEGFIAGSIAVVGFSLVFIGLAWALKYAASVIEMESSTDYALGGGTSSKTVYGVNEMVNALFKIATSILVLSAALWVVVQAYNAAGGDYLVLLGAVGIIAILSIIMVGLMAALTALERVMINKTPDIDKLNTLNDFTKNAALFLLSFGASIALIVGSLALMIFTLEQVKDPIHIVEACGIVAVIMAAVILMILGVNKMLTKFDSKSKKTKLETFNKIVIELYAISGVIAIISAIIAAMSFAFKYLNDNNEIWKSLGTVSAIIIGLIGLTLALKSLNKTGDIDFANIYKILIGLSIVLGSISVILVGLSLAYKYLNDNNEMIWAIVTMVGIIVALIGLIHVLKLLSKNLPKDTITNTLFSLLPIVVTLATLVGAIALLAEVTKDIDIVNILVATAVLAALGGMVAGLAALTKILKTIPMSSLAKLGIVTGSLVLLVGSFAIICASLYEMKDVLSNDAMMLNFIKFIGVLVAAVAVLVGLGAIGNYVGVGLLAISTAMLMLSVAVLTLAKSFKTFLDAFRDFSDNGSAEISKSLDNIAEGISGSSKSKLFDIMEILSETIIVGLDNLLADINEWWFKGINGGESGRMRFGVLIAAIVDSAISGIISSLTVTTIQMQEIKEALKNFVVELNKALDVKIPEAEADTDFTKYLARSAAVFGAEIIVGTLEGLKDEIGPIINAILDFINELLIELGKALISKADQIKEGIKSITEGLTFLLLSFVLGTDQAKVLYAAYGYVDGLFEKFKALITDLWNNSEIGKVINGLIGKTQEEVEDALDNSKDGIFGGYFTLPKGTFRTPKLIGMYFDEGLAEGIHEYSYIPQTELNNVLDNMSNGIIRLSQNIKDEFSSDNLTLRPVLDLTEIQNGTAEMSSMFNGVNAGIKANLNSARYAAREFNNNKSNAAQYATSDDIIRLGETMTSGGDIINATFNITGDNPQAIAKEVERIMENEILRRNINKGGLTTL